jgi:hypothetical protein
VGTHISGVHLALCLLFAVNLVNLSSQTGTFVPINFSNPAVSYVMVCLQHHPWPVWMSTETQDLSKHFNSLTNYLHHFTLVTPVPPNKRTDLIPRNLHCLCFLLMPTPDTFCGMCLMSEISPVWTLSSIYQSYHCSAFTQE